MEDTREIGAGDVQTELETVLHEYRENERKLDALTEEKQRLRERIQRLLRAMGKACYDATLGDEQLVLSLKTRTEVQYDEERLRQKLGQRYHLILEPDVKKIRRSLSALRTALSPYLDRIGSPSRELVRKRILSGELAQEDFQGTFEKTEKTTLYVKKRPAGGPPDQAHSRLTAAPALTRKENRP